MHENKILRSQLLLSIIVSILVLVLSVPYVYANVDTDFQTTTEITDERILIENESNIAYNKILESLGHPLIRNKNARNNFPVSPEAQDYNDNYAGAYLNEDGKLVVLVALSESSVVSSGALSSLYKDSNINNNTRSRILSETRDESEEPVNTSDEFKKSH